MAESEPKGHRFAEFALPKRQCERTKNAGEIHQVPGSFFSLHPADHDGHQLTARPLLQAAQRNILGCLIQNRNSSPNGRSQERVFPIYITNGIPR
jgi:hypothetical protein